MQEQERERQYRQSLAGDRARVALEELEGFLCKREESILARLAAAGTPDAAFEVACEYKALVKFVGEAQAAVGIGNAAAKKIWTEE